MLMCWALGSEEEEEEEEAEKSSVGACDVERNACEFPFG